MVHDCYESSEKTTQSSFDIKQFCLESMDSSERPISQSSKQLDGQKKFNSFDCTYCPFRYLTQRGLNNHIEKEHKHSNERKIKYSAGDILPSPSTTKHEAAQQNNVSELCVGSFEFTAQGGMKNNIAKDQSKKIAIDSDKIEPKHNQSILQLCSRGGKSIISVFQCPYCPLKYLSQRGVDNHTQREHSARFEGTRKRKNEIETSRGIGDTDIKISDDFNICITDIRSLSSTPFENNKRAKISRSLVTPIILANNNTNTSKVQEIGILCILCDRKRKNSDDITEHISTHFKTSHTCPHCPHVASSPAELHEHGKTKHYKQFSLWRFTCTQCHHTSISDEEMQNHITSAHYFRGEPIKSISLNMVNEAKKGSKLHSKDQNRQLSNVQESFIKAVMSTLPNDDEIKSLKSIERNLHSFDKENDQMPSPINKNEQSLEGNNENTSNMTADATVELKNQASEKCKTMNSTNSKIQSSSHNAKYENIAVSEHNAKSYQDDKSKNHETAASKEQNSTKILNIDNCTWKNGKVCGKESDLNTNDHKTSKSDITIAPNANDKNRIIAKCTHPKCQQRKTCKARRSEGQTDVHELISMSTKPMVDEEKQKSDIQLGSKSNEATRRSTRLVGVIENQSDKVMVTFSSDDTTDCLEPAQDKMQIDEEYVMPPALNEGIAEEIVYQAQTADDAEKAFIIRYEAGSSNANQSKERVNGSTTDADIYEKTNVESAMNMHVKSSTESNMERKFTCDICHYSTNKKHNLFCHKEKVHSKQRNEDGKKLEMENMQDMSFKVDEGTEEKCKSNVNCRFNIKHSELQKHCKAVEDSPQILKKGQDKEEIMEYDDIIDSETQKSENIPNIIDRTLADGSNVHYQESYSWSTTDELGSVEIGNELDHKIQSKTNAIFDEDTKYSGAYIDLSTNTNSHEILVQQSKNLVASYFEDNEIQKIQNTQGNNATKIPPSNLQPSNNTHQTVPDYSTILSNLSNAASNMFLSTTQQLIEADLIINDLLHKVGMTSMINDKNLGMKKIVTPEATNQPMQEPPISLCDKEASINIGDKSIKPNPKIDFTNISTESTEDLTIFSDPVSSSHDTNTHL
jgi:hypothetical protein